MPETSPRAARPLPPAEALLAAIVDSSNDAIISRDLEGLVTSWNVAAERMSGYGAAEMIGRSLLKLFPADRLQEEAAILKRLTAGERVEHFETAWVRRDGTEFHVSLTISPIRDGEGRVVGASEIARDITKQRWLEAESAAAHARAQRESLLKHEFLAAISHEMRSPLQAILNWLAFLEMSGTTAEEMQEGLRVIRRNAETQRRIIQDVLDMSHVLSGRLKLRREAVEVREVVAGVVESQRPAAALKGVQLGAWESGPPRLVEADGTRLQQIVTNLVANALKFTPAGGRVAVETEWKEEVVEIVVRDDGEGIAPDFVPYVFDRFKQGERTAEGGAHGVGLGLAIVRHLAELHHGSVTCVSEGKGKGAVFTVVLPLARPARPGAAAAPAGAAEANEMRDRLAGVRVLLVDDEPDALGVLVRILAKAGAEARAATRAVEALATLDEWMPHVVVTDISMPEHDGHWLLREVRSRTVAAGGDVPVLALTALAGLASCAGFQRHLAKPVRPEVLIEAIRQLAVPRTGVTPTAAGTTDGEGPSGGATEG